MVLLPLELLNSVVISFPGCTTVEFAVGYFAYHPTGGDLFWVKPSYRIIK